MACFDEKLDISIHERYSHCDSGAVRQNEIRALTEFFDHAEDVIPSTAIQARTMVTELIDDLEASAFSMSHGQTVLPLPFQRLLEWSRSERSLEWSLAACRYSPEPG